MVHPSASRFAAGAGEWEGGGDEEEGARDREEREGAEGMGKEQAD